MKTVSLFSGIGGLDLGLEDAGHEIILQVESDPHCIQARPARPSWLSRPRNTSRSRLTPSPPFARDFRARKQVLQHHFPGRALRRDVAELTELPPETELLAAGFPCPVRPNRRVFSELSERREIRARSRKRRRKRNA